MTWFRVDDSFATHPKVMTIPRGATRLRAVGLWTAAGTWCARHLTDGVFAAHVITEIGGTATDTRHLVAAGLWKTLGNDRYVFHDWQDWQPLRADVEADRAAARERMRRRRSKSTTSHNPPGTGEVGNGSGRSSPERSGEHPPNFADGSRPPTRPDPTTAAAAADERGSSGGGNQADEHVPPAGLPVGLDILRTQLQAYSQLAALRFDQLTTDQVTDLEALVELHGDARLVDVALRTCRTPPPVSVAAFLGTWHALPPPGKRLGVVRGRCATHHTTLTPSGVCSSCVADQRAGDR